MGAMNLRIYPSPQSSPSSKGEEEEVRFAPGLGLISLKSYDTN